jgi:hypothetical protein
MSASKRLLVLVGAAVTDVGELPPSVRLLLDAADEVLVVTPTLTTKLEWIVSDTDKARHDADERLATVLGQLTSVDIAAQGAVGDDSPLTVVEDHVRAFAPDHLLIALRNTAQSDWQERGLIEDVVAEFNLPVTVFAVDEEGRVGKPRRA